MAFLDVYPIYDLLEHEMGLVLCNYNCRISITLGSYRIIKNKFIESLVLMVYQMSEALNFITQ